MIKMIKDEKEKLKVDTATKEEKIHLPGRYELSVWDDLLDEEVDKVYEEIYHKLR